MSPDVLSSVCKQQSANEALAKLIDTIKVQYFSCSLPWRMIVGHGQLLFQIRASAHIVLSFTMLVACCYAMFLCFVQIRQNSLSLVWMYTWKPGHDLADSLHHSMDQKITFKSMRSSCVLANAGQRFNPR